MAVNALIYTARRSDLTFAEYKEYYETKHAPLVDKLLGDYKPDGYRRYYTDRSPAVASDTWLLGSPQDSDYDCCTVLTWRDSEALQGALRLFSSDKMQLPLVEDEKQFLDRTKTKLIIVGEEHGRKTPSS